MTTAVETALYALRDLVLTIDPSPQLGLNGAWVFSYQESEIKLDVLPVAIISKVKGVINPVSTKSGGQLLRRWRAEVLIVLAKGELAFPNAASAAVEATEEEYLEAMEAVLYTNTGRSLSGTVDSTGTGEGVGFYVYQQMTAHWQYGKDAYWCHRFEIPVNQTRNMPNV